MESINGSSNDRFVTKSNEIGQLVGKSCFSGSAGPIDSHSYWMRPLDRINSGSCFLDYLLNHVSIESFTSRICSSNRVARFTDRCIPDFKKSMSPKRINSSFALLAQV